MAASVVNVGMALNQCSGPCVSASVHQESTISSSLLSSGRVRCKVEGSLKSTFSGCVQSFKLQSSNGVNICSSRNVNLRAMAEEASEAPKAPEYYEVELEKPFGIKFYKGRDGGVYIDQIFPGSNADETKMFTPGDRVIATSAMFGTEVWPAAEYGRTMYTVRQRIGSLYMKVEKRYGKREGQAASAEQLSKERNAGSIGDGIREIQIKNYLRKQELKQQREEELNEGLKLYRAGKYEEALVRFESVLGLEPESRESRVACYNVACCYSKLNQVEAGLSALGDAMEYGFEDYKSVREDPDLANLRASPNFTPLLNKYDEPFLNENALNAIKNVFNIFGRK
ncbi:hypothetical protein R1sor_014847 [Riccia sorocarpa]|uniref:PDZ domain-containing protein n=1 Tax=Riccia sorocarpa TaxID=122646 RepID=A0ABD3HB11_9MARC